MSEQDRESSDAPQPRRENPDRPRLTAPTGFSDSSETHGDAAPDQPAHADEAAGESESPGRLPEAPSLPARSIDRPGQHTDATKLQPGRILLDYQIQRVLGRGAFGTVYLALQLSLNRLVALKVARNVGTEGRTMARLEHPNIVQVFAEQQLPESDSRLLSMQYVPGPTLQTLLDALTSRASPAGWTGRDLLSLIDERLQGPSMIAPGDFRGRARLEQMTRTEAVCFWGQELAGGLQFAHSCGVLHHDIKPANILLNAHGRPLLADFNLAESTDPDHRHEFAGGTLLYMAPENLALFMNDEDDTGSELPPFEVRQRADVYSLALVLVQLLLNRIPASVREPPPVAGSPVEADDRSASRPLYRRQTVTEMVVEHPLQEEATGVIAVLERACREDPADRTPSAGMLSDELQGCLLLNELARRRPLRSRVLRFAHQIPFCAFLVLTLLPHLIGSAVNIAYNVARIDDLAGAGTAELNRAAAGVSGTVAAVTGVFHSLTLWYNLIVWPVGIAWLSWLLYRQLPAIRGTPCSTAEEESSRRLGLLRLPQHMVLIAGLGWLPGLIVFPVGLSSLADVEFFPAFSHFAVNLLMSGSIAFSYSWMGAVWMILSVCYLRLWRFPAALNRSVMHEETRRLIRPLRWCRTAAGLVPLMSAVLIVVISPSGADSDQYLVFRGLLATLITVGMLGYHVSVQLTDSLTDSLSSR